MTAPKTRSHRFVVSEDLKQRLDLWLAERLDLSRSQLKRLIDAKLVKVNGVPVKAGYLTRRGDLISLVLPPQPAPFLQPEPIPLEIIYQDRDLAVINKPKNLVVHPGAGHGEGTLVNALLFHFPCLAAGSGQHRPGIVHRLDKDTSGLMVIAKNEESFTCLTAQLKKRTVQRHYLAVVQGVVALQSGLLDKPLGRHPKDRKKMAVLRTGRPAQTHFLVQERFKKHSLLLCRLITGRTHQIRVHLASMLHPIVGDPLYGFKTNNLGAKSPMLHAVYLAFQHPKGHFVEFQVQPPAEFKEILQKARQKN